MIGLQRVGLTYPDREQPALRDVCLTVEEGELCVVVGPTGSGKSTLLGLLNGAVPHLTGGLLTGRAVVDGRDTRTHRPRDLAGVVGVVGQDPAAGFVTGTVEEELAFGMEQLGLPADTMRKRAEETLDLLGLAALRGRSLPSLSGGEQQRVAIGAVLTAHPRILVLDEPTSALDPVAAEDVLAAIARLVHDVGVTAVVAEHRLERIVQFADRIVEVRGDGTIAAGRPEDVMATSRVAPPVVRLGRRSGWDPLPLSIRDARRRGADLRASLTGVTRPAPPPPGPTVVSAKGVTVTHGATVAVRSVDVAVPAGAVVALMGRNGSGKSSLLWALQGSGRRERGSVAVGGTDPADLPPSDARGLVGLVPQRAADLLYASTVAAECAQGDVDANVDPGTCRDVLDRLLPGVPDRAHPRDLSEGQRLALVLAVQLAARPRVMLLDEPTRGLDYPAKDHLAGILRGLAQEGRSVVVATHDVEFVAGVADRVLVMAEGELVADGPTAEVVTGSPVFAPQVAKILRPVPLLTVDEVATAQRLQRAPEQQT